MQHFCIDAYWAPSRNAILAPHIVHIPTLDLARLARYFRAAMVDFFLQRSLISERLARSLLERTQGGFSVDP
jgi:hypothetical protein